MVNSLTCEITGRRKPLGNRGPQHGPAAVGRLLPEQDQIGAFLLERARERVARAQEIRALEGRSQ